MIISRAHPEDVPDLVEIQTECELSPWTSEGYRSELERPDSVILIARDTDGRRVGFIVGRVVDNPGKPEAEIYNIGIRPPFQHRGIGTQLLSEFLDLCRKQGVTAIWLEVRVSNLGAIAFYGAHGFVGQDRRRSFYSDPIEDADVMVLRIKS